MKITVPYIQQERINSCGLAVLRMVFKYYDDSVTEKELLNYIKLRSFGTLLTDLGIIALKRNYKVIIHTLHLPLIGSLQLPFSTSLTGEHIQAMNPRSTDKDTLESFKKFLNLGGTLIWQVPRQQNIEENIQNKIPVIINYNTAAIGDFWKTWDNGHYVVVNGFIKNEISVLDPDKNGGEYIQNAEELIPAMAINARMSSGHTMIVTK